MHQDKTRRNDSSAISPGRRGTETTDSALPGVIGNQSVLSMFREREENHTGIPVQMKNKIESHTGIPMDSVRVHYNSDRPKQVNASSYIQGNHIFIGPGRNSDLLHELGHWNENAVKGPVRPTTMVNHMHVNDEAAREKFADQFANKFR